MIDILFVAALALLGAVGVIAGNCVPAFLQWLWGGYDTYGVWRKPRLWFRKVKR